MSFSLFKKKTNEITLLLLLLLLSSFIYLLKNWTRPTFWFSSPTCCCFSSGVLCLRWLAVLSHDFHCVWLTRIPPTELQLAVRTYIESETTLKVSICPPKVSAWSRVWPGTSGSEFSGAGFGSPREPMTEGLWNWRELCVGDGWVCCSGPQEVRAALTRFWSSGSGLSAATASGYANVTIVAINLP